MCIQSIQKYCLNFCASVNNSHLGVFLWELSINYAVSQQEWRTLKGNSLLLSYQVNKQEMGTSKLRVHSLVYESDDSHTRHPCDLHKPIATQGKCENVLAIVNECKGELTEVAGNLMVLFHSWCRKLTELGLRNNPNCTHVAVYLVSSLELTVYGEPGRPKYEINEETLLHFRALGYKWKDIAELLLVSCWTLWR